MAKFLNEQYNQLSIVRILIIIYIAFRPILIISDLLPMCALITWPGELRRASPHLPPGDNKLTNYLVPELINRRRRRYWLITTTIQHRYSSGWPLTWPSLGQALKTNTSGLYQQNVTRFTLSTFLFLESVKHETLYFKRKPNKWTHCSFPT